MVDGCSHALLMENPHEVERHLHTWLAQQAEAAELSRQIELDEQVRRASSSARDEVSS